MKKEEEEEAAKQQKKRRKRKKKERKYKRKRRDRVGVRFSETDKRDLGIAKAAGCRLGNAQQRRSLAKPPH